MYICKSTYNIIFSTRDGLKFYVFANKHTPLIFLHGCRTHRASFTSDPSNFKLKFPAKEKLAVTFQSVGYLPCKHLQQTFSSFFYRFRTVVFYFERYLHSDAKVRFYFKMQSLYVYICVECHNHSLITYYNWNRFEFVRESLNLVMDKWERLNLLVDHSIPRVVVRDSHLSHQQINTTLITLAPFVLIGFSNTRWIYPIYIKQRERVFNYVDF